MKRSFSLIFTIIVSTISFVHAQSINATAPISEIILKGSVYAELIPAQASGVEITAHGISSKNIDWSLKNGKLSVCLRVGLLETNQDAFASVKIYYTDISYIGIESATIIVNDVVECERLKIETLGGKNDIEFVVATTDLYINATGDSRIVISGSSQHINAKAYMGAKIDCGGCSTEHVIANAKQKSEIVVNTSGELHGSTSAGSNIFYIGSPSVYAPEKKIGRSIIAVPPKR